MHIDGPGRRHPDERFRCADLEPVRQEILRGRRSFLRAGALSIAAASLGLIASAMHAAEAPLPIEGQFPPLGGATGWVNSQPLSASGLRGKVVLINFCTYTCINWLRSLPYVRAWFEEYRDRGLVVIGVHTPEFSFEKDIQNVRRALKGFKVQYPIALDNEYAVWRAFDNRYWPALYLIDSAGQIRNRHFGEGEYARSEKIIQQLLAETGKAAGHELVSIAARGIEAPADWSNLKSQEN